MVAVVAVCVSLVGAACSGAGTGRVVDATTASAVTTATTAPAATTTTHPVTTTTRPATTVSRTTTTVITDATKADRKALTAQLQAVVDRYQALYLLSRSDPNRPFTDLKLIDQFSQVASEDVIARLIQSWQRFRAEGSAARLGPSRQARLYLTTVTPASADQVAARYCILDDAVLIRASDGVVLDAQAEVARGEFGFRLAGRRWILSDFHKLTGTDVRFGEDNPCAQSRS
jgi:hypothetical protein